MTADIGQLVQRSLAGDDIAIRELIQQFEGMVFGVCMRMLGQRQDAEDVTQEVFVRAIRSLSSWDSGRAFQPWLLAIAGNRCRTRLAQRSRRPPTTPLIQDCVDGQPNGLAHRALVEEVDRALGKVRSEYRTAFLLFHEQELSYEEIAAAMDCPVGTAKTWVHRARRRLAEELVRRGVVAESRS